MQHLQQEAGFKESAKLLEMWASIQLLAVLGPGGDGLSQRTDIPSESAAVREICIVEIAGGMGPPVHKRDVLCS